MGVTACDRRGCTQIMCDRLVDEKYLCGTCMAELLEYKAAWPPTVRVCDVQGLVGEFFDTEPGTYTEARKSTDPAAVNAEFWRLTDLPNPDVG